MSRPQRNAMPIVPLTKPTDSPMRENGFGEAFQQRERDSRMMERYSAVRNDINDVGAKIDRISERINVLGRNEKEREDAILRELSTLQAACNDMRIQFKGEVEFRREMDRLRENELKRLDKKMYESEARVKKTILDTVHRHISTTVENVFERVMNTKYREFQEHVHEAIQDVKNTVREEVTKANRRLAKFSANHPQYSNDHLCPSARQPSPTSHPHRIGGRETLSGAALNNSSHCLSLSLDLKERPSDNLMNHLGHRDNSNLFTPSYNKLTSSLHSGQFRHKEGSEKESALQHQPVRTNRLGQFKELREVGELSNNPRSSIKQGIDVNGCHSGIALGQSCSDELDSLDPRRLHEEEDSSERARSPIKRKIHDSEAALFGASENEQSSNGNSNESDDSQSFTSSKSSSEYSPWSRKYARQQKKEMSFAVRKSRRCNNISKAGGIWKGRSDSAPSHTYMTRAHKSVCRRVRSPVLCSLPLTRKALMRRERRKLS